MIPSGASITPIQDEATQLISQAIDKNVDVATMERLLAMRRELRGEKAKEVFDEAMANFQAHCPVIEKKKVAGSGNFSYNYAPLEYIVEKVKSLISENGFSYTFDTKQEEGSMTVYCKVKHKLGHMEVSEFQLAIDKSARMNTSQQYGAALTYGKRYAFMDAFGIVVGGEDTDASSIPTKQQNVAPRGIVAPQKSSWQTAKENPGYYKEPSTNGKGLVSTKQTEYIRNLLKQKSYTEGELCKKYGVTKIEGLTSEKASKIIDNLLKLKPKTISKPEVTPDAETEPIDIDEIDKALEEKKKVA